MLRPLAGVALCLLAAAGAGAATFQVDRTDDEPTANACTAAPGDCSLRGAILQANATPGADTVVLPAGVYALTVPATDLEDDGLDGDLDVNGDLTLTGAGASTTVIQFCTKLGTCAGIDRVLDIGPKNGAITVTISGVTIRNGHKDGFSDHSGGGIRNAATLTLKDSIVTGNSAANSGGYAYGGAISNSGTMTIVGTTVAGNQSSGYGGGIVCQDGSALTVNASTISGNTSAFGGGGIYAGFFDVTGKPTVTILDSTVSGNNGGASNGAGGGVFLNRGTLTMRRSTVSGNVVGGQSTGGGIAISGGSTTNTLENCTISGNHAASGGGVASTGGAPVTLLNCTIAGNAAAGVNGGAPANGGGLLGIFTASDSIVAGNSSVTNAGPDCAGTLTSGGYDLIQDVGDCTVSAGPGNLTGLDAQLAPLADNGGTVTPHPLTRAPLPLSPVVNAGNPATPGTPGACAATDERGVARPQPPGDRCDIGAFEDVHPVTTTTTSTTTTTTVTTITVATTTTSTSVTVSTTLATSTTAESTSTTSPSTTSTSATISTGPTTSTTGPGGSTTTTTTVPGTPEICGDCIDNDGNGLTDFEDPACCVGDHVVTLTWKRGRIRPGGAISALRLRTRLATTAGIDPKHQTVYVQLRQDGGGELLCAQIPTTDLLKAVGGYVFRDPAHRVKSADGLTRLRLVVTKKGVGKLTTSTKDAPFRTPVASLLTLTVAFHDPAHPDGDRCAASTQSFNATRKGALHFP